MAGLGTGDCWGLGGQGTGDWELGIGTGDWE